MNDLPSYEQLVRWSEELRKVNTFRILRWPGIRTGKLTEGFGRLVRPTRLAALEMRRLGISLEALGEQWARVDRARYRLRCMKRDELHATKRRSRRVNGQLRKRRTR